MRLTKEREAEIRRCMSCHETELIYEIDELKAENAQLQVEWKKDDDHSVVYIKRDYLNEIKEERDALQLIVENQTGEILNLQSELQYLQTERDSLKADLVKATVQIDGLLFAAKNALELNVRIEKLRASLEETGKDIVENAPDTIWTSDCINMTVVERIQQALAADEGVGE